MTSSNSLSFYLKISNDKIWKDTKELHKYLPKDITLNSWKDDTTGVCYTEANVLTDLSFCPNINRPERRAEIFRGINIPLVNLWLYPIRYPQAFDRYSRYGWHDTTDTYFPTSVTYPERFPFSVKIGLIKRNHLAFASSLRQQKYIIEAKLNNEQRIIDETTNLLTYNEDDRYDEAIYERQLRISMLTNNLATVIDLQNKVDVNLSELEGYTEEQYGNTQYNAIEQSLTHFLDIYQYLTDYPGMNWARDELWLSKVKSTFDESTVDFPFNRPDLRFYNPFGTDGRIDFDAFFDPYGQENISYFSTGKIYKEEYVDERLYPKGTPLNELTASIRNTTNAPIISYLKTMVRYLVRPLYINESYYFGGSGIYLYNEHYTNAELKHPWHNIRDFAGSHTTFHFERNVARYFRARLDNGIIGQDIDTLPDIIYNENNFNVVPRISIRWDDRDRRNTENNTFFSNSNMLAQKTPEVDYVHHTLPAPQSIFSSGTDIAFNHGQYNLYIDHVSPKEATTYLTEETNPFDADNAYFNEEYQSVGKYGAISKLLGDGITLNAGTSQYIHHIDYEQREPEQVINTISNYGEIISGDNLPYSSSINTKAFNHLHKDGRYHCPKGFYDVNDRLISASGLGDRYNKEAIPDSPKYVAESDEPLVVYRRGHSINPTLNGVVGTVNNSGQYIFSYYGVQYADIWSNADENYTLSSAYAPTSDIIWHGRNPDSPVSEPFVWLYKCQKKVKRVGVYEVIHNNGRIIRDSYHFEAIRNGYFYHNQYVKGPHTDMYDNDYFYDPINQLPIYEVSRFYSNGQFPIPYREEFIYGKEYRLIEDFDSDGNLTSSNLIADTEISFEETPVENIVNRLRSKGETPDDLGDGWEYDRVGLTNGLLVYLGHVFPWPRVPLPGVITIPFSAKSKSDKLDVRINTSNAPGDIDSMPVCTVNFEIDAPI